MQAITHFLSGIVIHARVERNRLGEMQAITHFLSGIVKSICYSVEHMSVTQWSIFGITSVVLGFLCLRSTKH